MIVIADKNGGIYLKFVRPGDRFDVEVWSDGNILLTRSASMTVSAKAINKKRGK